jgi:mannose-1-phosphate guanylyltransferase
MMADDFYALIMAGGGGTRLWPLSRLSRPKQMLRLIGDRTLFQMAVDRLLPIFPAERILVVTVQEQVDELKRQAPEIPESSFLIEPEGKGTASVIGLGATALKARCGDCVIASLPADHYIENGERFRDCLMAGYEVASKGFLVTLGIPPTYPATGYGYIKRGGAIGTYGDFEAYAVDSFKEKPSLPQAEQYHKSGEYAWNSGVFVWKAGRIIEEIERQMKHLHNGLMQVSRSIGTPEEQATLQSVWKDLEKQTILVDGQAFGMYCLKMSRET